MKGINDMKPIKDPVGSMMAKYKHMYDMDLKQMAGAMLVSAATIARHMNTHPDDITLFELRQMIRIFKISPQEMIDAIYGGIASCEK